MNILITLGAVIAAYFVGIFIANSLRMKSHGWKIGLILVTMTLATIQCQRPPKLGVDLSGGTILVYEIDMDKMEADHQENTEGMEDVGMLDVDMTALIDALRRRIDPTGVKEIVIRPYGMKQVEIIIPKATDEEIDLIKESIVDVGYLKFRIIADRNLHPLIWQLGEESIAAKSSAKTIVQDGKVVAEWVYLGREEEPDPETGEREFKVQPAGMLQRELVPGQPEVLVLVNDEEAWVEGRHLAGVSMSYDPKTASPSVNFRMNREGAIRFGDLTGTNLPDEQTGAESRLGIVMNEQLLSAPLIKSRITSQGEITGRFTEKEVQQLVRVLKAGRLPAVLHKEPISDNTVSPLLGRDTIRKGTLAISGSIIAVLIFMLIYYRFAGIVAALALIGNLVMIVALMISIDAAFTLPGLAGLVLTIGMSVDANVLIFERMREERAKGAALRMAIRNGFGRATTTIIDANVTTLITAVVLYVIAPDNIKGFAITLILGILVSMYTAIFCSRVAFDIAEKKGWLKELKMAQILGNTNFNFLGMRKMAAAISLSAIVIGLVAVGARGKGIFDIDFKEGTSVQIVLRDPMPIGQLRGEVDEDWTVTELHMEGQAPSTVYKIDSPLAEEKDLQARIQELFQANGRDLLKTRRLEFSEPMPIAEKSEEEAVDEEVSQTSDMPGEPVSSIDGRNAVAEIAAAARTAFTTQQDVPLMAYYQAETEPGEPAEDATATGDAAPTGEAETPDISSEFEPDAADGTVPAIPAGAAATVELVYHSQATLTFEEPIPADSVRGFIRQAAEEIGLDPPIVELSNENWDGSSSTPFAEWTVKFTTEVEQTNRIREQLVSTMESKPVWLSSNKIGATVAADMRNSAIVAILVSLLGIIGYIWIRFQRVGYGLAAVLALVHDVAITLGAIGLSLYLASVFGFLLIDEFKISLSVVAAFLTIIGYSLNDTIVVFDRIREVKGKSPDLNGEMINTSVNQTLSRTLLTSTTTFLVVAILYAFGGDGIHAFAFALLVGVIVGTYSSIFVASPALLWMSRSGAQTKKTREKATVSQ